MTQPRRCKERRVFRVPEIELQVHLERRARRGNLPKIEINPALTGKRVHVAGLLRPAVTGHWNRRDGKLESIVGAIEVLDPVELHVAANRHPGACAIQLPRILEGVGSQLRARQVDSVVAHRVNPFSIGTVVGSIEPILEQFGLRCRSRIVRGLH